MKPNYSKRLSGMVAVGVAILSLGGCIDNDPANSPAGPGVENPAAASPNSIIPAVGGPSGNGGGVSGGAASGAVSH